MFQFIYNVLQSIFNLFWMILLTIITGKMSKISPYHFDRGLHDNGFFNICSDEFIKTNHPKNVSPYCKKLIIEKFLDEGLSKNKQFLNVTTTVSFPIFDGKEITGSMGCYSVIQNCIEEYIKSEILKEK